MPLQQISICGKDPRRPLFPLPRGRALPDFLDDQRPLTVIRPFRRAAETTSRPRDPSARSRGASLRRTGIYPKFILVRGNPADISGQKGFPAPWGRGATCPPGNGAGPQSPSERGVEKRKQAPHGESHMISLTRLNNTRLVINPDLIVSMEETPDTMILPFHGGENCRPGESERGHPAGHRVPACIFNPSTPIQ